ncbi:uncharacterized protein BO96DRAFT_403557 [Aspergillus niger CBS 101883]|uniref:Uncharacterized protein n=3 Tax=Aspergillus niger TaxID=5061 RepID=A2R6E5_ASPNC|nr:uncharacterized protein BO96DRAFT_403557 [Aspergillus niger CBS 101883]XP_059602640.1 hypothetical protein An15g07660 [Aspergillus niger]PYH51700.1 hypothetical protein BO96DRAFT_403557 [Aspergillus niger CBS 101883]RDH22104.1 hypothetical protein M747DRAFT_233962 [Aspergillus niger ATCC 13496]CAK42653.1 hypothetical protein An15g07660 [Aspergillus niger]
MAPMTLTSQASSLAGCAERLTPWRIRLLPMGASWTMSSTAELLWKIRPMAARPTKRVSGNMVIVHRDGSPEAAHEARHTVLAKTAEKLMMRAVLVEIGKGKDEARFIMNFFADDVMDITAILSSLSTMLDTHEAPPALNPAGLERRKMARCIEEAYSLSWLPNHRGGLFQPGYGHNQVNYRQFPVSWDEDGHLCAPGGVCRAWTPFGHLENALVISVNAQAHNQGLEYGVVGKLYLGMMVTFIGGLTCDYIQIRLRIILTTLNLEVPGVLGVKRERVV